MEINKVQLPIRAFGADVYQALSNAEKAQEWLRNFHDGLVYGIRGKSSFADKLMDEAKAYSESQSERANSRWNKYANGFKGGRPRKNSPDTRGGSASPAGCAAGKRIPPQEYTTAAGESASPLECGPNGGSAASAGRSLTPRAGEVSDSPKVSETPTKAELYDFAEAARLSEADAREWWELCTERGWKDRYGKPIRDGKKACERYCARRAINRMAKGET